MEAFHFHPVMQRLVAHDDPDSSVGPDRTDPAAASSPESPRCWAHEALIDCIAAGQWHGGGSGTQFSESTELVACRATGQLFRARVLGSYLRGTRRTDRDGSQVAYLQLAHNERHPRHGSSVAKVIHNVGRAETVDRNALVRLVSSISRFLTPEHATAAATGAVVDIVDSRPMGGARPTAEWRGGRAGHVCPGDATHFEARQQARCDGLGRQSLS